MPGQRSPTRLAAVTAFRSDGRRLATTGPNGDLKVWDTADPRHPQLLMRLSRRHRVVAAAWNPTAADLLATLSTDASISIWRMVDDRPAQELMRLRLPYGRCGALAWLPDGRHLACASTDGVISLWDLVSGTRQISVSGDASVCVSIFPDRDGGLRAVYRDGSVREPGARTMHIEPLAAAAWSMPGGLLAVARHEGSLEVREASLQTRWAVELAAEPLLVTWHGDSTIVAADWARMSLTALDVSGRALWQTQLGTTPTSLSAAQGMVAVGGHPYAPRILELDGGTVLSGAGGSIG